MYYSLQNLLLFYLLQLASVPEFIVYCLFFFYCSLTLPIFPAASFIVEKLVQQKYISEPVSYSSLIIADQQFFFTMKMNCSHRIFLPFGYLGFLYILSLRFEMLDSSKVNFYFNITGCCFTSYNHHHSFSFVSSFCYSKVSSFSCPFNSSSHLAHHPNFWCFCDY